MKFINCYNKLEIDRINELMKTNPMLAKFEIEKYLTKFPNYYWGYVMQANILIILGEIQKANEVLNFLEEKINIKKDLKKHVVYISLQEIEEMSLNKLYSYDTFLKMDILKKIIKPKNFSLILLEEVSDNFWNWEL